MFQPYTLAVFGTMKTTSVELVTVELSSSVVFSQAYFARPWLVLSRATTDCSLSYYNITTEYYYNTATKLPLRRLLLLFSIINLLLLGAINMYT